MRGYGLVAECDLPKVETRVRFSVPAQQKKKHLAVFLLLLITTPRIEGAKTRQYLRG